MQIQKQFTKTIKFIPAHRGQTKPKKESPFLTIYLREKIELITVADIIFLKAESNYSYIHLSDGKKLLTSRTLKRLSERLNTDTFIRTHQSYIVRKDQIKTYIYKDQNLLLSNGSIVPVARKEKAKILDFFATYGS